MDKTDLMELEEVINNTNNNSSSKENLLNEADTDNPISDWQEEYAYTLGTQAYICAYSWLYFAQLRYDWISKEKPDNYQGGVDMAYNQFYHYTKLVDPKSQSGGSPNNDTLYSLCFLDLDKEPIVFTHPDIIDRYFSFELASMTSDNFGYIGERTTGSMSGKTAVNIFGNTINKSNVFLIAGPNWDGTLPKGLRSCEIVRFPAQSNGTKLMNLPATSPTRYAFGLIRTEVRDGVDDVEKVNDIQKQYILTPLSQWVHEIEPRPENRDVWEPYHLKDDFLADWRTINRFMNDNPCLVQNKVLFDLFKQIGIGPGIELCRLDKATKKGLARAAVTGRNLIETMGEKGAFCTTKNNWIFPPHTMGSAGYYGDFATRGALQCAEGMISNDPEEATYPNTTLDSAGDLLNGTQKYTMTFKAGELPDVDAFWSLTMYDLDNKLVLGSENYCISSLNPMYKKESDGSLILYIQAKYPGSDKESNWLQSPKRKGFSLVFRAYLPGADIINKSWGIPGLVKQ